MFGRIVVSKPRINATAAVSSTTSTLAVDPVSRARAGDAIALRTMPRAALQAVYENGQSLAHYAAANGNDDCLWALFQSGAQSSLTVVCDAGKTPARCAHEAGHDRCVQALRDMGIVVGAMELTDDTNDPVVVEEEEEGGSIAGATAPMDVVEPKSIGPAEPDHRYVPPESTQDSLRKHSQAEAAHAAVDEKAKAEVKIQEEVKRGKVGLLESNGDCGSGAVADTTAPANQTVIGFAKTKKRKAEDEGGEDMRDASETNEMSANDANDGAVRKMRTLGESKSSRGDDGPL